MRAQFIRGQDPKKSMKLGEARFPERVKELQAKVGTGFHFKEHYLDDEDFEDDGFIVYLFKNTYDKWKEKSKPINPDEIKIWKDTTSGNSPIIKISAPGIKETTLLRGEAHFQDVSNDIIDLLNSSEIKKRLANKFSKSNSDLDKLGDMILTASKRKGLDIGSWTVSQEIGRRLIDLIK
jgi:hypothetical protein